MEEYIELLEEFKDKGYSMLYMKFDGDRNTTNLRIKTAIENLIKGYRKLEERNKELFETCCRYEDTLEHYEYKIFDELDDYIKLDEIRKLDKISIKGKKYISEMKVKEKIEELNKKEKEELKGLKGQDRYFVKQMYMYKRNILQELMKG